MLRIRQKLGKYRIERRLGTGGFANVYAARDTVEGLHVALKVPHARIVDDKVLEQLRHEIRMCIRLEHPNILPLRFAGFYEDEFIISLPLGEETLQERLSRRMSLELALDLSLQILEAVACAHRQKVVHCDIKPENMILFPGNRLKLADFGIARVAQKTLQGGGTGTVGYMAPEQAMGKPSFRADVFSIGLVLCRMFSGEWPEYPFDWPTPGHRRLRSNLHPDLIEILRRSLELNPRKRFRDADQMLTAFRPAMRRTLKRNEDRRRKRQTG